MIVKSKFHPSVFKSFVLSADHVADSLTYDAYQDSDVTRLVEKRVAGSSIMDICKEEVTQMQSWVGLSVNVSIIL